MENKKFNQWCRSATLLIRYGPDRKAVAEELRSHMEDHYDALIEKGVSPEDAVDKVIEAMGDDKELSRQLAAIHRPFWGYFLRACKIVLILLLCLSFIPIRNYIKELDLQERPDLRKFNIYSSASYDGDTGRTLHHLSQPDVSFTSDGSIFTLTDAAVFTEYSEHFDRNRTYLYVLIRQRSLLPWSESKEYQPVSMAGVSCWFSARDSLGNTYVGWQDNCSDDDHPMLSAGVQSGIFTYTHECWINDFPVEAEWVEIFYVRDGRNYSLIVDLTGGDRT